MIMNAKIWVAAILVASVLPMVPPAEAGSCKETDSGYGWEEPTCSFSCQKNELVSASITGGDSNDYVEAKGDCGGAYAFCNAWTGSCGNTDADPTTSAQSKGACEGKGYDGSWYWISVTVHCFTSGAGDKAAIVITTAMPPGAAPTHVQVPPELGVTSLARIVVTDGVAVGTVCNAVEPGLLACHAAPVRTAVDDGFRTYAL